ncbi:MAG: hypothetical protein KAH13_04365, partial [Tenericutes bacterium]|nr:hypothetical protein [Mycoplasmatota bacterium]
MEKYNLHILTPNKNKKRYFGVDYFMNITTGYNPAFKYYSTPLDPNSVYKDGPITLLPEMYHFLEIELSNIEKGSIIGVFANSDIYDATNSIEPIVNLLEKYEMGLFIETTSQKIIDDLPCLKSFSLKFSLLVAITSCNIEAESKLLNNKFDIDKAVRIIKKLRQQEINCGMMIKPIIPLINDSLDSFQKMIEAAINHDASFVYTTFTVKFDSKKIKEFYDIIDLEFPELMNVFHDKYGYKTSWESDKAENLKKNYVIYCRKHKVLYAMKDIINLYKPDLNIQLKLF